MAGARARPRQLPGAAGLHHHPVGWPGHLRQRVPVRHHDGADGEAEGVLPPPARASQPQRAPHWPEEVEIEATPGQRG